MDKIAVNNIKNKLKTKLERDNSFIPVIINEIYDNIINQIKSDGLIILKDNGDYYIFLNYSLDKNYNFSIDELTLIKENLKNKLLQDLSIINTNFININWDYLYHTFNFNIIVNDFLNIDF